MGFVSSNTGFWTEDNRTFPDFPDNSQDPQYVIPIVQTTFNGTTGDCFLQFLEQAPPIGNKPSIGGFPGKIVFTPENQIFLGSNPAIDIFSIPAGFNITAATFSAHTSSFGGQTQISVSGVTLLTINPDNGTDINVALPNLDLIAVFNDFYVVQMTSVAGWNPPIVGALEGINNKVGGIAVNGTYNIIGTSWQLSNLTHPNYPPGVFNPGDTAQLTASGVDLTTVTSVTLTPRGGNPIVITSFILQETLLLQWQIPCPDGTTPFTCPNDSSMLCCPVYPYAYPFNSLATIQGTSFSGSIVLGNLIIWIANPSGMYQIVPGKTHDTVYLDSGSQEGETGNVAIPNPFIETGFIDE